MRTSCERHKLFVKCLLFCPLIVLAAGCGSKDGTVSGKVTYKGKSMTGGEIHFIPASESGNFATQIEKDGSYSISKLPPGPAKITIMTASPTPPMAMMGKRRGGGAGAKKGMEKQQQMLKGKGGEHEGERAAPAEIVAVPEKYADPEKSGLQVDVKGGRQSFDIKID